MNEIIETLESIKNYHLYDMQGYNKDLDYQRRCLASTYENIAEIEAKIAKAQAFIDQHDAAIELLRNGNQEQ